MKNLSLRLVGGAIVAALFSLSTSNAQLVEDEELLANGGTWSYLLYATEANAYTPTDPSLDDPNFYTTWQLGGAGYDGPPFLSGQAPLGYGEVPNGTPPVTNIWGMRDGVNTEPPSGFRFTAYFRVVVTPTSSVSALRFSGVLDDGAVIYVNGAEVVRTANVPAGDDLWDLETGGDGDEANPIELDVTGLSLPANQPMTVSVSVHSTSPTSSDMSMDFRIVTLSAPQPMPPANDNFASAQTIPNLGTVTGRTHDGSADLGLGATNEVDEPMHGTAANVGSVWYVYQPAVNERVAITAAASSFDAVTAVYTGDAVDDLTLVGSSATGAQFYPPGTIVLDLQAGVPYAIAVDGENGGGGAILDENFGGVSLNLSAVPDSLFTALATLLPAGSDWEYLLTAEDSGDPTLTNQPVDPALFGTGDADFHSTWHTSAGYDGPPFSGPAPALLGYGTTVDPIGAGPIVTDIWEARDIDGDAMTEDLAPPGGLRYAAYFRTTFTPASAVPHLGFRGLIDDGAAIFINGVEVSQINFLGDASDWQALASTATNTETAPQEGIALNVNLPANVPVEIGVTVRNSSATSSDMAFDLEVYSIEEPVIDFGVNLAAGPAKVSFQNASPDDMSGAGDGGPNDNLSWTASAGSAQNVAALPNPPGAPGGAIYVNNGAIDILTGHVDLGNVANNLVVASFDFRTFEDSGGSDFEADDTVEAYIEGSTDGVLFTRIATITPVVNGGTPDALKPLEKPNGEYTTYVSSQGAIPASIRTIRVVVAAVNTSNSEHFFVDNICVEVGAPPRAPFIATIERNGATGENTISWNIVEGMLYEIRYGDLNNWTTLDAEVDLSSFTHTPPPGDTEGYYQVREFED